ncbi:hypothetical protein GMORB2_1447 [Geosmithia morbida]|uniref:Uncharacterized protein n=1 Tax=Geosmithia morbida TaxID=1094350 RepID=A0A9P4Z014_9HYPO|nr:uncharacterized protein GMORB2_1447 [Geosmithia morbida]KAF4126201.1 hypothetical protein GMORB2_1447 [Geosmithia morbida]
MSTNDIISMLQAQLTQRFDKHQQARAPDRFNAAIDKCLGHDRASLIFQKAGFYPWFAYCVYVASLHGDNDALNRLSDGDLARVADHLNSTPVHPTVNARIMSIFYGSKRANWRHGRVSSRIRIPAWQDLQSDGGEQLRSPFTSASASSPSRVQVPIEETFRVDMQSGRPLKMPEDYLNPELG